MFLGVEQKKGDTFHLHGMLTVYVTLDLEPAELLQMSHPIASVVHNGFLVAQGNFKEQTNLKDFLQSEMGLSLEEGLEEIIERLDGLESALDPNKLREKIENMKDFEDFIPTPAKIVPFHSEADILAQEGDVFFGGKYKSLANANLCVNAFPILYQARFREYQLEKVRLEIEQLIFQIEKGSAAGESEHFRSTSANVSEKLLKEFIPAMIYSRNDPKGFQIAESRFRDFMDGYNYPEDIEAIHALITGSGPLSSAHTSLLALYAKKISALHLEQFALLESVKNEIIQLRKNLNL